MQTILTDVMIEDVCLIANNTLLGDADCKMNALCLVCLICTIFNKFNDLKKKHKNSTYA